MLNSRQTKSLARNIIRTTGCPDAYLVGTRQGKEIWSNCKRRSCPYCSNIYAKAVTKATRFLSWLTGLPVYWVTLTYADAEGIPDYQAWCNFDPQMSKEHVKKLVDHRCMYLAGRYSMDPPNYDEELKLAMDNNAVRRSIKDQNRAVNYGIERQGGFDFFKISGFGGKTKRYHHHMLCVCTPEQMAGFAEYWQDRYGHIKVSKVTNLAKVVHYVVQYEISGSKDIQVSRLNRSRANSRAFKLFWKDLEGWFLDLIYKAFLGMEPRTTELTRHQRQSVARRKGRIRVALKLINLTGGVNTHERCLGLSDIKALVSNGILNRFATNFN